MPATDTLGSVTNPIPQDFIWCEEDNEGVKTWYTNRNGGLGGGSGSVDLSSYLQLTGGTLTGDLLLPEHPVFEDIPLQAAVSKADVVEHETKIFVQEALPETLRNNSIYILI